MTTNFKLYSGVLKAYTEETGGVKRRMLRTTASSTIRDLVGDEIRPEAISKMADQARDNMTIWLNHSYQVPEDMLGSVRDAQVIQRGVDEEGTPIIDLDLDIALEEANPRAVQTWDAIENGTKLGTSIGAQVRHATKRKGGGLIIDDIHLLEASIVGIPANPRSWVQSAIKSLKALGEEAPIDEEAVIDEEVTASIEPDKTDSTVNIAIHIDANEGPHSETTNDYSTESETESGVTEAGNEVEASAPVDLTKDADENGDEVEDSEKLAARTRVTVTIDSDAPEAPRSRSGNAREALADETAQGDDAALGDEVTRNLPAPIINSALVQEVTDTMKEFREELTNLRKQVADLTDERNEYRENLNLAMALLEKVKDLPLARKAQPTAEMLARSARSRFDGFYDPEVIKLLEKE